MMNNVVIKSARLLSWQPDCCRTFEKMEKGETLVICSQRQVGKSFTCAQILLYVAVNYKKSLSIYISPTNDSSRKFFGDIKGFVENSAFTKKVNESLLTIEFVNGSKILFRSAESKLRGYSCKNSGVLVVDEAYYVPEDIWEVVLPFTNVDNSKKIIISTPRFRKGMFWKFYQRAVRGDKGYYHINTADYDTSMFLSDQQKEEYKVMLSPQSYKSEVLGQWLDNDECLFGDYSKVFHTPDDTNPEIVAIDWSNNGGDNCVISGFNKNHEQCMLEIVTKEKDPVQRAIKLATIINSYPSIRKVIAEKNSIGEVYISILKKNLNRPEILEAFVTTNESKKRIIEKLISAIGQKTITLLPHPQLDLELSTYEMQELKNGNYTYNGKKDDCIMATAFAVDQFDNNRGKYVVRGTTNPNPKLSLREKYN